MFCIIILPEEIKPNNFKQTPFIPGVIHSKLITIESELDRISQLSYKLLQELYFQYDAIRNNFEMKIFNDKNNKMDKTSEPFNLISDSNLIIPFTRKEYEFIDCFYIIIEERKEKAFYSKIQIIHNLNYLNKLAVNEGKCLFQIFCLKKELKVLQNELELLGSCYLSLTEFSEYELDYRTRKNNYIVSLANYILECIEIYIHSLYFRAFSDALLRYGLPINYVFNICEIPNKNIRREMKKIQNLVENSIRIGNDSDDDEYAFTFFEISTIKNVKQNTL